MLLLGVKLFIFDNWCAHALENGQINTFLGGYGQFRQVLQSVCVTESGGTCHKVCQMLPNVITLT